MKEIDPPPPALCNPLYTGEFDNKEVYRIGVPAYEDLCLANL